MRKFQLTNLSFIVGKKSEITAFLLAEIARGRGFIVLPASLNDLSAVDSDSGLRAIYRKVTYCVTDGMPLVWFFNWHLIQNRQSPTLERVYGPTLMTELLKLGSHKTRHFLYGAKDTTLQKLNQEIRNFAPQTTLVGQISPPFRAITPAEEAKFLAEIRRTQTQVLWIGLSSPKQVRLAVRWQKLLPGVAIFCVGAAFDFLAKQQLMAPPLMQKLGLEWLFRLIVDPVRLWKRYLWSIPRFLFKRLFVFLFGY